MNSSSHGRSSDEMAAHWAAKIDGGSMSEADRQELERWLSADPAHRLALSAYCQLSTDLEQTLPQLVRSGSLSMPESPGAARRPWLRAAWAAGICAAAAALAVGVWLQQPEADQQLIATSVGQRQSLTLRDGTRVELNARTNLAVQFRDDERRVRLADGQAFFQVAKDPRRAFVVETPSGSVRVTGTEFDVRADARNEFAVTVVEGSVQVSPVHLEGRAAGPTSLVAGQQLIARPDGVLTRSIEAAQLEDLLAWRRGQVVFDGTSLGDALAEFARYHGRSISAAPEVASLTLGGRYNLDNLDDFLNAIEAFLPVQVLRDLSGAISVTPRTGN